MSESTESLQKMHYNRIAQEYSAHYGDEWSQAYRRIFMDAPMLDGIDVKNTSVLEAMCGNGVTTAYLLQKGAKVTGLDISEEEINHFHELWPNNTAICTSILDTGLVSESFDCVVIVGGLHHVHPHVQQAIDEIHRLLRPGGYFCFIEPHKGTVLDWLRHLWYRRDKYFAANEEAIDLAMLRVQFSDKFEFIKEEYRGNVAYLLVLNSLILRIPLSLKPFISQPLLWLEGLLTPLLGKATSCFSISQWRKRGS